MKFFTKVLTSGSMTISASDNVLMLTIKTSSAGSCTFQGSGSFQGGTAQAMTFGASDGITLFTQNPQSPLDGIIITWVSGSVNIVIGQT